MNFEEFSTYSNTLHKRTYFLRARLGSYLKDTFIYLFQGIKFLKVLILSLFFANFH